MFTCDYCEILKSTYFEEHPRTAASVSPSVSKNSVGKRNLTLDVRHINQYFLSTQRQN